MNNVSKLMLSAEEQLLVSNCDWILTKRTIINKVCLLLGALSEAQKSVIEAEKNSLPEKVLHSTAKISKGENYLQLPYVLLDYPRCFEAGHIFAIRTFFWWGHFFSLSLHLSGKYKQLYQKKIIDSLVSDSQDYFICVHDSQWHHHFETDNYKEVKQMSKKELADRIGRMEFIKLSIKFPLQQWEHISGLLDKSFKEIIDMLKA